ncbi:hypothetical protein PV05_03597 [Exophiala xenobiotica]|uniref:Metallo-beta-lactamase domain-containing protein n=1 Tax=Exophiala xenobiotica TaxID=348802 RepID=A0A0D2DA01_9EURO|nr:uncharacterized protein PV05_03597 [Exophiala xenobiotica]KIW59122.1 hypothetical protein PV05_03597 [Exophiala xenobiotica]
MLSPPLLGYSTWGEKVGDISRRNATKPYFVQRLTERNEGVLVLDPPERQGENLLKAIAEITTLPVTAIVYSHNHADHILGAKDLVEAANKAGVSDVRIITSSKTVEKMELLNTSVLPPNESVEWSNGTTKFEGITLHPCLPPNPRL